ncbi:MAG: hypothetical protein ACI84C_002354 [Flavobacteriales bacterium]|jgi:hypothetical protein
MLQRIQSIYLLLASLLLLAVVLFPLFAFDGASTSFILKMCSFSNGEESLSIPTLYWVWLSLAWLTGLMLLTSLFGFKNRKGQMKRGRLAYVLILAVLVCGYFTGGAAEDMLPEGTWTNVYGIAFYLPAAALAFNFLANRSIKGDEDLVKSLDRLR